ncbi:MAG TPA: dihydroorotase [Candidatus Acidoferrales bacterium]|jgi:dihydroorotase|nr:dihydroorotase [Candidatus Acidoferrales bacterium]
MLLIKNGRVLDPSSNTDASLDILVDGSRISKIGASLSTSNAELFDASGMIVAPGFIDLHCHLREPGQELSETIETGTRAAARGGFTAVCTMPNTQPINDNASVTRGIVERAASAGAVRVWPIGAASVGSKGEALAEIAAMKDAGIVAVSDDGKPVATARLMRQVMDYCRALNLPVIDHCEDPSLFAGGVMREGPRSLRLGLKGIPSQSESICVGRDVEVAMLTSARLHIAHMSTRASLEYVRAAKKQGLSVTCEVTPHHFTLIDEDVRYDSHYKMNPPLASREDRAALIEGLADGSVDAIATDHAPHHPSSKDVEFDRAPFGITGFETALALGLSELVHAGKISLKRLVELFTTGPARVLGIERKIAADEPADLTIFSPDHSWTFRAADSPSKSRNTPFDGRAFRGAPMATIVAGRIVYRR